MRKIIVLICFFIILLTSLMYPMAMLILGDETYESNAGHFVMIGIIIISAIPIAIELNKIED